MIYRAYSELAGVRHVVVDGSAQDGTVLTLSHWPGAATPDLLRADLSAEIAFNYLDHPELHSDAEFVSNNHFDQDGLVSVFALTQPEAAQARRERLIDIARAGDFSCFRDRDAARAAITIANIGNAGAGDPYDLLLPQLASLADDVTPFREYWAEEDEHITETERAIAAGTITIEEDPELDLAIVTVPSGWSERVVHRFTTTSSEAAHPYAVHNVTDRFAIVTVGGPLPQLRYRYETWVHYMSRRPRPRVDLTELAAALTAEDEGGGVWTFDGVDSLSPALHLVLAEGTSITAERFATLVIAELRARRSTWSPYPEP
jgi:hypothetical protein